MRKIEPMKTLLEGTAYNSINHALKSIFRYPAYARKMYNPVDGTLAIPSGHENGVLFFVLLRYDVQRKKWVEDKRRISLPSGDWKISIGVTEDDLIEMATTFYRHNQ